MEPPESIRSISFRAFFRGRVNSMERLPALSQVLRMVVSMSSSVLGSSELEESWRRLRKAIWNWRESMVLSLRQSRYFRSPATR